MKFKTTAKAIRYGSPDPIALGYCEAAHLLRNHEPVAYTCGVYGWNFDVYVITGKTICTGYRGMVGRRPSASVSEYEDKARNIWENCNIKWEDRAELVENLLSEFIAKA